MSKVYQKKSLRYVPEACGGTIDFEAPYSDPADLATNEGRHIPLVGTAKCIFCVGIYFSISITQAFCAHIHAYREPRRAPCSSYVSVEEGEKVKNAIMQKLRAESTEHGWTPSMIDKNSVILVCPQPDRSTNRADEADVNPEDKDLKLGGWYVAEGIKQFLQLPISREVEAKYQGFVVHHSTGYERMLAVVKSGKDHDGWVKFVRHLRCRNMKSSKYVKGERGRLTRRSCPEHRNSNTDVSASTGSRVCCNRPKSKKGALSDFPSKTECI